MHELGGVLEQVLSSITKGEVEEWESVLRPPLLCSGKDVEHAWFSCSLFKYLSAVCWEVASQAFSACVASSLPWISTSWKS